MSAFMNNPNANTSQAELMMQYMNFCMFQKQQQQDVNMFEQFMKQQEQNNQQNTNPYQSQQQNNNQQNTNQFEQFMQSQIQSQTQSQTQSSELPIFEQFMSERFKTSMHTSQTPSFIPFDIDNFNGDGLQKSFDLAYQTESKKMSNV